MSLRPAREMKMSTKIAMMLRYSLDRPEQAAHIEKAIRTALRNGVQTGDIWQEGCQRVDTREICDAALRAL